MKRAALVTGAAFVGIAWVVTYKVTPHPLAAAPPNTPPSSGPPDQASPAPSSSPVASPAGATGVFTGNDVPNRYGDVQVKLVIANGRITDVQAIQLPNDRAESAYISQQVRPWLHDEVIQAQSARIDIISGATYTSDSYAQSVESALKKAHMG